ncbi:MAG TPA: RNA polymerase sigma factor SigZ [Chryseolinea sp.]|nr:RNA polymerase sigma factor SigZ [Chryseolinea sp.]HPM29614.1 RNA polymerase sigma factor SigZ [Chryseolinea sp.]
MKALESIPWTKTQQELKSFVYYKVKDKALAEDIVQDVFLKIHSRLDQLKDDEKIISWIYQITRNTITDHFRAQAKSFQPYDLDWESNPTGLNDCVSSCLNEMLLTLPEKYREAIELTEFKNLTQLDLADKLNISYSGAKSRVQRARQMLKEKMEEQYHIKMDAYGNVIVCENRSPCNCTNAPTEEYL